MKNSRCPRFLRILSVVVFTVAVVAGRSAIADDPDPDTRAGLNQIFQDGCQEDKNPARRSRCLCLAGEFGNNLSDGELRKFIWIAMGNGLLPSRALGTKELVPLEYGDKRLEQAFGKCRG